MEFKLVNYFVPVAMLLAITSYSHADSLSNVYRMAMNKYDHRMAMKNVAKTGTMKNCGTVPFNITWSPDPVSPSQLLKVHVDYTVPHDMDGGTYNITIWFHGDPDPFLEFADVFNCSQIKKYIPCPLPKGLKVHKTEVFEHIPNIGSYPGDYDIRVELKNKKGQQLICLKAHVPISKN